jgi:hypothetical protein
MLSHFQCPVKIGLIQWKVIHYWTKWLVGIWAPPLWSMWMSCKLDAGSSNLHSFTGLNVHSTSIYLRKHWCCISIWSGKACKIFVLLRMIIDKALTTVLQLAPDWSGNRNIYTDHLVIPVFNCSTNFTQLYNSICEIGIGKVQCWKKVILTSGCLLLLLNNFYQLIKWQYFSIDYVKPSAIFFFVLFKRYYCKKILFPCNNLSQKSQKEGQVWF